MAIVRWARHGENEANLSLTLSHRVYDADLTELGRRQAAALAERLAVEQVPVRTILSSPLRRARQTADVVAARLGLPISAELEDLREIDVGSLDGRRDDEAWEIYHRVLGAWAAGDRTARFPDGENGAELVARVRRALLQAAEGCPDAGSALIVAHGGNIQAALPGLTGRPEPAEGLPTGGYASWGVTASDGVIMHAVPLRRA